MASTEPYRLEALLKEVRRSLPKPILDGPTIYGLETGGSTVLVGGDPYEAIVRITGEEVTVSLFHLHWEGSHEFRIHPIGLGSLSWDRQPSSSTRTALRSLIKAASEMRRATFKTCQYCERTCPPESMDGTIVWPMAATDDRIKAACAIYGVGWNTYPDEISIPDPSAGNAEVSTWRRSCRCRCPAGSTGG